MKRFIKHLILFLSCCILVLFIFNLAVWKVRDTYMHLPKGVNKVFLGNSTFEYGIDDTRIPGAFNFAHNAEPIDIMYAKFILLKRHNPALDTVFVELDEITLFNDKLAPTVSNIIYLDAFDFEDWKSNFRQQSFERFTSYFSHAYDIIKLRPIVESLFESCTPVSIGVGGYARLDRDKLTEDIQLYGKSIEKKKYLKDIPAINRYYYQKLVRVAEESGVEVIFLITPRHRVLNASTVAAEYKALNFPRQKLMNYSGLIMPDSCFGDLVHLNFRGAGSFSDTIADHLRGM